MVQLESVAVPLLYTAAVVCGVSADGAVGERYRAIVVHAAAIEVVDPVDDGQAREGRGDAIVHLEHTAMVPAADRHARRGARNRLRPAGVAQIEPHCHPG